MLTRILSRWFPAASIGAMTGGGDRDVAVTATGATSQANSYGLKATLTEFTTVAANTGARLPTGLVPGDELIVVNRGANTLLLYPETGGILNLEAANAKVDVATAKTARVVCIKPGYYSVGVS